MAKNNQIRVSPQKGDGRKVKQTENSRASGIYDTKSEATAAGRNIARNQGLEMVIQNKNGQIGEKNSYGPDYFPPKG